MTVVFVIAAVLVYKTTILTRMMLPRTSTQVEADEDLYYPLTDGDHMEQTFFYPSDELLSAGTRISLNEKTQKKLLKEDKKRNLGTVKVKILDASKKTLMSADYAVSVLADEQNLVASFPGTERGWEKKELTIVLDAAEIHEEVGLKIGYAAGQKDQTSLLVNGQKQDATLNIRTADRQFLYWKLWGLFGAVLEIGRAHV